MKIASDLEILMAIDTYIEHYGTPPSVRNLAMMLGFQSISGVQYRLRSLAANGLIERQRRAARSIRLQQKAFELLTNIDKEKVS